MASTTGHLSEEQLGEYDLGGNEDDGRRGREHLETCEACRRRRDELLAFRALLARSGQREGRPRHDVVPRAMMRLRLRRYSVTNTNELFEGFAALVRGLASLFSLPPTDTRRTTRVGGVEEERHG